MLNTEGNNTTNYGIISLLMRPIPAIKTERKISGLPLNLVLGTLAAAKISGQSNISEEALGAPERLARNKDGSLKLDKNGQTSYEVAKEVRAGGRMIWFNFTADLAEQVTQFNKAHTEQIAQLRDRCAIAAKPLFEEDNKLVKDTIAARMAAIKKAEDDKAYADLVAAEKKAETERLAKLEAENTELKAKLAANAVPVTDTTPDTPEIVEVKTKKASKKELAAVA